MQKFFELHRKEVITGAGVLLFMIAGAFAMIIMPSEKSPPPNETPKQKEIHESESKIQEPESTSLIEIYVYITGAVNKPGVYKFPEGSRVFEVVEAAGGFTPKADISALNLAETFSDAQHIHIPPKGERPRTNTNADTYTHITVQPSESNRKPVDSILVDINHASENELQRLKGVGPAIAKRIYEYRQKHGRFNSAEDLINVRGIGQAMLEKMRSQILTGADTYTHITSNRKPADSNLVDINHASENELQRLKGVGPAIAKRIYEYRQKHGRFNSAEDLINVRGIGQAKLEKMKSQIIIR